MLALVGAAALWVGRPAANPADLAPAAPELQEAEQRLRNLLVTTTALEAATTRLQVAWALPPRTPPEKPPPTTDRRGRPLDPSREWTALTKLRPTPADPCEDLDHVSLGWRIERFGAAWREAAQATRAAAARVQRVRAAPMVAPLLDGGWAGRLDGVLGEADRRVGAWREASEWQARYVRPLIQACPVPELEAAPGVVSDTLLAEGDEAPLVAVLARGDGHVCPGGARADDAVVLLAGDRACWSATLPCNCAPEPVAPGAVLAGLSPTGP